MRDILFLSIVSLLASPAIAQNVTQLHPPPVEPVVRVTEVASGQQSPLQQAPTPPVNIGYEDYRVLEVPMNDATVIRVPTHPSITTTLIFPEPITALEGAGFTADPDKTGGDFLFSYTPGGSYFSVSPRIENARRNLNVVIGGKVYAIEPFAVPTYTMAVVSVKFVRQAQNLIRMGTTNGNPANQNAQGGFPGLISGVDESLEAKRLKSPPKPEFDPAGAGKLIGVIDTIKVLSGLKGSKLSAALKVMPHIQFAERGGADDIANNGDYTIRLDHVLRNNKIDCLSFEVTVTNKSQRDITFDPQSFGVRAGGEFYPQVVCDFSPVLTAHSEGKAFFAIITSPSGSPNYLAVNNAFRVSVDASVAQEGPLPTKVAAPRTVKSDPKAPVVNVAPTPTPTPTPTIVAKVEAKPTPARQPVEDKPPVNTEKAIIKVVDRSVMKTEKVVATKKTTVAEPTPPKAMKLEDDVIVITSKDGKKRHIPIEEQSPK